MLFRTLPGILESGLWQELGRLPPAETRALVTDVGNDILYGSAPAEIVRWVEECVLRLKRFTRDIVLTDLPLASTRRLSRARFLLFRSILFPRCRLSLSQVLGAVERVAASLAELVATHQVRLFRLKPEWYGFDPIHIRPRLWRSAWREILCGEADGLPAGAGSFAEALRLYLLAPERRWLAGWEQRTPQTGVRLPRGARVWLY